MRFNQISREQIYNINNRKRKIEVKDSARMEVHAKRCRFLKK